MSNLKKTPHDELFKKIFKNRENAGDLLRVVLPQNIIARIDMKSVYVEDVSYLDENLAKHFSDLILSLNLKKSNAHVKVYCLLEHKSHPINWWDYSFCVTWRYSGQNWWTIKR